jgi:hypothetical protein
MEETIFARPVLNIQLDPKRKLSNHALPLRHFSLYPFEPLAT